MTASHDTPNFTAIASEIARLVAEAAPTEIDRPVYVNMLNGIADRLRRVWNARGAADIAKIESELAQQMGATASGPYTKNLDRALRALDR
jgi:hypothetical protein